MDRFIPQLRREKYGVSQRRPEMRRRLFHLQHDVSFLEANKKLFSFVFVRDPFQRIASAYYDKMDRNWNKPAFVLSWMRNEIITRYLIFKSICKTGKAIMLLGRVFSETVYYSKFELS